MRRFPTLCAGASLAVLFAGVCAAQSGDFDAPADNATPAGQLSETLAPAPQVHLNFIDQKLALSLAVDTQSQIETAEFALKSASNDELRRLITSRLESQRAFAEQLDQLTDGRSKQALVDALGEIEADKTSNVPRAKSFRPLALQRYATSLLVRVRLEILQEYDTALRCELVGKDAGEFDRHFLRSDMLRQLQLLATLKVFQSQASPDFAQVIHKLWSTANEQYALAKGLLLQLETAPLAETTTVAGPLAGSDAAR
jgi:hypothetical protein